jgi:hypothetical protein
MTGMRWPLVPILAMLLTSCDSAVDPARDWREFMAAVSAVAVPDTVALGTPFTVAATSSGSSCEKKGEMRVLSSSGMRYEVAAFDFTVTRDRDLAPCQDILQWFAHAITLIYGTPGEGTVAVKTIRYPLNSNLPADTIFIERRVVVILP